MPATKNPPNGRSRAWPAPTRKLRLLLPLAYMTAIFALSSIPDTAAPETGLERALQWVSPELQNLLHIPLFGGLAWCWHWGLQSWVKQEQWRLGAALALTLLYAVLDEVHQLGHTGALRFADRHPAECRRCGSGTHCNSGASTWPGVRITLNGRIAGRSRKTVSLFYTPERVIDNRMRNCLKTKPKAPLA